jgi:hypothetical protein
MRRILLAALTAPLIGTAWADVIYLKDGSNRSGTFVSGTGTTVTFHENGVRRQYELRDVQRIDFGTNSAQSSPAYSDSRSTDPRYESRRDPRYGSSDRVRTTGDYMLPAGTELVIRTNEEINSESSAPGRVYSAEIERDVMGEDGRVVVPNNSRVELVVSKIEDPNVTSEEELTLTVRSLTLNGRRYEISTEGLEHSGREGIGRNRRTAEMVGGGAALGTVVGAVAGGGKGALIGALIGAIGGGTAQILTKGDKVNVPAESVLTFRLDQAVRLAPIDR